MNNEIVTMNLSYSELGSLRSQRNKEGTYISYLRGKRCKTVDDFFREVSASLQFPWYFGNNWPAFDDCVRDLEDWMFFAEIIIIIDDFSLVFPKDTTTRTLLLKHLKLLIEYWKTNGKKVEVWLNN